MSDRDDRTITPFQGGFFQGMSSRIKLIIRLMADRRVNPLLKLLPVGALLYLAIPDLAIGPVDDALLIWLGTFLFVELCPPDVVQEHMERLEREMRAVRRETGIAEQSIREEDIIDAEYWEEKKTIE